jgi:hypothetical protein
MNFVAVKSVEQQDMQAVHRVPQWALEFMQHPRGLGRENDAAVAFVSIAN